MYEYKMNGAKGGVFKFETTKGAFYPTDTSNLLIEACRSKIKSAAKILDLGCGIGITGIVISKMGLAAKPLFVSDISKTAVMQALKNAGSLNVEIVARCGSLFEPWEKDKFDIIVDDVSGISDEVAKISPWFPPGVTCEAGRDGTKWIEKVIDEAPKHLKKGGVLFFPVLSLSNEKKILSQAKKRFSKVNLVVEKEWLLPKEMIKKIDRIMPLIKDGTIGCVNKFGTWIWSTKIFCAS